MNDYHGCGATTRWRAAGRWGCVAAIVAVFSVGGPPAAAQTTTYTTSTGHELRLPPVSALDCTELDAVLTRISGTDYRPIGQPRPVDPRDDALFAYEDAASVRWQENCERGAARVQSFGSMGRTNANWGFGGAR